MQNVNQSSQAGQSGASTPTVLIVDDSQTSAIALEVACSTISGVDVRAVNSAIEAVRILADQSALVCAVVTDIRMPAMDGFELIRRIRNNPRYAATPVIVVTADTDPETSARCRSLGANACFPKPFSPGAVREALEKLIYDSKESAR